MEHAHNDTELYELEADVEYLRDRVLFLSSVRDMLLDAIKKVHGMGCVPPGDCLKFLELAIETEIKMSTNYESGEIPGKP